MMLRSLAISLALFASLPAAAQDCAELHAPWAQAGQVVSATDPAGFAAARIEAGQAVLLDLHPDGEVAYRSLPQGEGEAASSGGMAVIAIAQPGRWQVAIDRPGWVDLVGTGGPAEALRFGPGEPCSGIRKAVTFALEPGEYVLEVSGVLDGQIGVLVEAMPAD